MKISSSEVHLLAQHQSLETKESSQSLTLWKNGGNSQSLTTQAEIADTLSLSEEAKSLLSSAPLPACQKETEELKLTDEDKLKIKLIESFIKALTGKDIRIKVPQIKLQNHQPQDAGQMITVSGRVGWGLIYEAHEEIYEKETMSFSASGLVKTADGREIALTLQLNMSREFYARTDFSLRMGDAVKVDPLVINYGNNAPALTTAKYAFDLDCDGTEEQISFLQGGSGFLVLDKNGDNIINNGSELFGPQSGNGFEDLALYDQDGNNWIDENDPIFSKLRIWSKDENGNDQLLALGQIGIGAIYLGHVQSLFSLKNGTDLLGQLRETGLFLREDGSAGTVQHLDLAV